MKRMMKTMSDKPKFKAMTTPKGSALFCKVAEPNTRFNADGEYEATVILNEEEHKDFLQQLDQLAEEAFAAETEALKPVAKKKAYIHKPYSEECDKEGNPTGNIMIKTKMKAKGKKKDGTPFESAPTIFDAAKPKPKELDRKGLLIGNGSIIRINFVPRSYYVQATGMCGVSLQLRAVQVIDLKSFGGDAKSYGFDGENDGIAPMDAGPGDEGSDF